MPYMVGQASEKLVSRFTRMHQAAHAEPHLLCHKATGITRGLASKCCYGGFVYTSVRLRCREIYNFHVMLEFPLRMEDNNKERFILNDDDTEDMLSKIGLHHPFLSSHPFSSISQMFIVTGRLLCRRCPRSDPVNGRLNGMLMSELRMMCKRHFQQRYSLTGCDLVHTKFAPLAM